MILVDTSVWIDFFRGARRAASLSSLLEAAEVILHPDVYGEIALGHLGRRRSAILADLECLPATPRLRDADLLDMIETRSLAGSGIGWVDAHVLGAALLAGAPLWTFDRPLLRIATRVGVAHAPHS